MRFLNSQNYPESVFKAAYEHLYRPDWNVIRVTELLSGLLQKYLLIKHWDTLEVDVDDLLLSLFGTAWHKFLSGWAVENEIHDRRWYTTIDSVQVTGETDIYRNEHGLGIIEDNKVTSAWAFVFGRKEWEYQLNSYTYLVRANNYPVHKLYINAFLRDWSKWDLLKDRQGNYPKSRFFCSEVPLWSKEDQLFYLRKRLRLHQLANKDGDHPDIICTPEERWQSKEQFAVTKKGNKNAYRCYDTEFEAKNCITNLQKNAANYEIIHRPGGNKLCEDYCIVRSKCPYKAA